MAKEDITPYKQNLALKLEFTRLELDITEVMEFTPLDLDLENRRLQHLLAFVKQYQQCGGREAMEAIAGRYLFVPIFPGIAPDSDWYRFENWMQGKPVRGRLSEQLPETLTLRKPEEIEEHEIEAALESLESALDQAGFGVSLNEGIPGRLMYAYLYESLGETVELDGGGWFFDGCSGYCPGCFQRPWCSSGESSCWPEDEESGKIHLIPALKAYVSASPQSLEILRELQAEENEAFEDFRAENPGRSIFPRHKLKPTVYGQNKPLSQVKNSRSTDIGLFLIYGTNRLDKHHFENVQYIMDTVYEDRIVA